MIVTISGTVCGLMPPRTGLSKNGNEWVAQYIVIAINDNNDDKFAFQIFGKEKLDSLRLANGMKIAVTLDFSQAKGNDGVFFTNVMAKDVFVLPKRMTNNSNNYGGNQTLNDII